MKFALKKAYLKGVLVFREILTLGIILQSISSQLAVLITFSHSFACIERRLEALYKLNIFFETWHYQCINHSSRNNVRIIV